MKRMLTMCLCCVSLLCLMACNGTEDSGESVAYYVTKQYMEHDTGDINLTTYGYNDEWVIQSSQSYLNGVLSSGVEYSYNEDATVVTVTTTSAIYDPTVTEIHQTFDDSGKMVRAESYSGGTLEGASEYTYDSEGRESKVVTTDSDGGVVTTLLYDYDKKGNLVSYVMETPVYSSRNEYSYDRKNRLVTMKVFHNDELVSRIEYTWEGNTKYGSVFAMGEQAARKTVTVYDDVGNVLVEENYDLLGALQYRTCYEYTGTDGSVSSGIPQL